LDFKQEIQIQNRSTENMRNTLFVKASNGPDKRKNTLFTTDSKSKNIGEKMKKKRKK
jgi:hypothetical protein